MDTWPEWLWLALTAINLVSLPFYIGKERPVLKPGTVALFVIVHMILLYGFVTT